MLSLAALWKSRAADFDRVSGDPLALAPVPTLDELRSLIERSPELRAFANEARLQEARLQLARSASATDIEWRAGVRWLEEDGTWAAVAGVSIPLGSSSRAAPATRAAQAELAALSLARETESLTLETTLIDAHLRLSSAAAEVAAARDVLLPKLDQAEQSAARAFRAGALTYTEWAQLQGDASEARREQLLAADRSQSRPRRNPTTHRLALCRGRITGNAAMNKSFIKFTFLAFLAACLAGCGNGAEHAEHHEEGEHGHAEAEEAEHHDEVTIDEKTAAELGVRTAKAGPGVVRDEHEVQGLLTPIEGKHARVRARFPGASANRARRHWRRREERARRSPSSKATSA